ncbi:MAG: acyl-ACP--UDP-N-acetylglucosamine O-acyltransferase [Alphaproteobacteria bacterium]|nr:MAG: acyl-ACP--UDP-N-acetylglucosamine O-acyltransferase [Alphaproteobacteria bacterium]TAF15598.1 MAG: acyl-ACP--UDP-N-acetylglucosamine O-acyltransferase [Alphaproteobacteria bacterium]TAF42002.1 MAG: acyl-ACP--UDP-N-acetylglucosamine O-acyltransferase [Alphaproteobacteria bacterium]TAF76610.1 MAG: acyl-ACP--UDP-N-acetylglucosamine O-acyltransferase [Alphaproteobacteria bacterium]
MNHHSSIHPTAIIHPKAQLGTNVSIGAYSIVGEHVTLHDGVTLMAHVFVDGHTTIGAQTIVYPFTSLGTAPQDLKYRGEPATLIIGEHNTIREHVTMNIGTEGGGGITRVGNHGLYMVGVHVAHDCAIGNHVIMANNATLAGHVSVGDYAVIGGLAAVHQFVRIGHYAMIGGMSGVEHDVIPFGSVMGERAHLSGLNLVGLKRGGFTRETIHEMRALYRALFHGEAEGSLQQRAEHMTQSSQHDAVLRDVLDFIRMGSKRSLCVPKQDHPNHEDAA